MQERTVTIDRETHRLSPDFTVFATQNPIESEGTYPLPEAQKDRFMLKINITWPERDHELDLARRSLGSDSPEAVLKRGEVSLASRTGGCMNCAAPCNWCASATNCWNTSWKWCAAHVPATTFKSAQARAPCSLYCGPAALGPEWPVATLSHRMTSVRWPYRHSSIDCCCFRIGVGGCRTAEVLDRILHEVPVPR